MVEGEFIGDGGPAVRLNRWIEKAVRGIITGRLKEVESFGRVLYLDGYGANFRMFYFVNIS